MTCSRIDITTWLFFEYFTATVNKLGAHNFIMTQCTNNRFSSRFRRPPPTFATAITLLINPGNQTWHSKQKWSVVKEQLIPRATKRTILHKPIDCNIIFAFSETASNCPGRFYFTVSPAVLDCQLKFITDGQPPMTLIIFSIDVHRCTPALRSSMTTTVYGELTTQWFL